MNLSKFFSLARSRENLLDFIWQWISTRCLHSANTQGECEHFSTCVYFWNSHTILDKINPFSFTVWTLYTIKKWNSSTHFYNSLRFMHNFRIINIDRHAQSTCRLGRFNLKNQVFSPQTNIEIARCFNTNSIIIVKFWWDPFN